MKNVKLSSSIHRKKRRNEHEKNIYYHCRRVRINSTFLFRTWRDTIIKCKKEQQPDHFPKSSAVPFSIQSLC